MPEIEDELVDRRDAENVDENQLTERTSGRNLRGNVYEIHEVRNVGERRIRRPPNWFDKECYMAVMANDLTADINEPTNIQ